MREHPDAKVFLVIDNTRAREALGGLLRTRSLHRNAYGSANAFPAEITHGHDATGAPCCWLPAADRGPIKRLADPLPNNIRAVPVDRTHAHGQPNKGAISDRAGPCAGSARRMGGRPQHPLRCVHMAHAGCHTRLHPSAYAAGQQVCAQRVNCPACGPHPLARLRACLRARHQVAGRPVATRPFCGQKTWSTTR